MIKNEGSNLMEFDSRPKSEKAQEYDTYIRNTTVIKSGEGCRIVINLSTVCLGRLYF